MPPIADQGPGKGREVRLGSRIQQAHFTRPPRARRDGRFSRGRNPALLVISQLSVGSALAKGLVLLVALPAVAIGLYWYLTFPNVAGLAKINPRSTAFIDARSREAYDSSQLKAMGTPISPRSRGSAAAEPKGRPVKQFWIWVPLSRISRELQRAVIVAEDATFYHHHGFDWEGMRGAATRN